MDIGVLTQMLRNIDLKNQTIMGIMQYCWLNKSSGQQIIKLIQRETLSAKKQKKICYLYLLHEIMVQAQKSADKDYIRYIGVRIKNLIIDFSRAVQNYNDANNVNKLVDRWNGSQIFAGSFIDKLKQILLPVCKKLLQQSQANKQEKLNMKYSKTFLIDYNTIQDFQPTQKIYDNYVDWIQIQNKLIKFNQQYSKLDMNNPTIDSINRSSQLLRAAQQYRIQLIALISSFHSDHKVLGDKCRSELEYVRQNYEI